MNTGENIFFGVDGPLGSMPVNGQMRIANLSALPGLVRRLGADPTPILERHDIDPQNLADPDHYVECKSVVDLFEYCSNTFNDSLFGLQLAQMQNADVFGCVAALCRSAATVRESLNCFMDYIPVVHSPNTLLEMVEGEKTAEIRWGLRTDLGLNRQANYQAVLLDMKLLRLVAGEAFRPSYVNLAVDARPRDIPELERTLGCRFNPTKADNAIAFPTALLDQPVTSANRTVFRLLGGYLQQVKMASRTSLAQRVEDYVRGSLSSGHCCIEHCARKLSLSVRTLQAHLSEQGLVFSEILERQRYDLARGYLAREDLTLDDIAALLGYAEQSSFGRAFKRWSGTTPKLYRQQLGRRVQGASLAAQ
ncbi:AraC family transcriptional regulator [Mangrovimicrobium sediminis]|uniref:AraC family transcriptional regulator n=1 Tax=Mangrovimicrobium sediminis TaxID=2562682 RepID=A0A4Z0LVS8_9GAMM|nr:AraC family transcriptional regulator [Haliea sp. SAOS-164]TGD71360.1 AraC family transcriptional regulator [Haliea sp. SAOS-164]